MKKVVLVSLLIGCLAPLAYGASQESAVEKKHTKRHRSKSKKSEAATFGNCIIDSIYNKGHHRVLFITPKGHRYFIKPNELRKVAVLFTISERKAAAEITTKEVEENHYLMDKGDHSFVLRLTPDGLTVHRIDDAGTVKKGRTLLPVDTQDVTKDLAILHAERNKTGAFKLHDVGELQKEMKERASTQKRSSLSSIVRKNGGSSAGQGGVRARNVVKS
ncbi:MAG: hypothetical protein WD055_01345 [Candidatus Dependentiae bacterium]